MKIELKELTVREIVNGYLDSEEEGVIGFGGKLNIRPKYQREFVYDDKKRNAVIETIRKGYPLNVMYWAKNTDGTFEVIDGQQRTISFCSYVNGDYSIDDRAFYNLTTPEQNLILDYKLMIYVCDGNEQEKLDWFKIINIAGEKLTDQELRNASYTGPWLTSAKRYFSKTKCPAYLSGKDYLNGSPIRQDYLETVLDWISDGKIADYMGKHQHDPDAHVLWLYFLCVIEWIKCNFITYRKEMKGLEWGKLYNKYKNIRLDRTALDEEIHKLMLDDDVTNKKGIYYYVLSRQEKYLNIRTFSESQKRTQYEKQQGICKICEKHFDIKEMEADHIIPWHDGGQTSLENCQMLCKMCNRTKSGK